MTSQGIRNHCVARRPRKSQGDCGSTSSLDCQPDSVERLDSYSAIVEHYRECVFPDIAADMAFYGDRRKTPAETVEIACRSIGPDGRLHSHQHRLGYLRMEQAADFLTPHSEALMAATNFTELHQRVSVLGGAGLRIGDLAIYDIAQRIGWYRGLAPEEIYLHRGTLDGDLALDPSATGKTLSPDNLPDEFRQLAPFQLEDVLCIYKAQIRRIAGRA